MPPQEFVDAAELRALQREHAKLLDRHRATDAAARDLQRKSYEEGREDARREYLKTRSTAGESNLPDGSDVGDYGDGIVHLTLPDNRGCIQFHVVGPLGPRPITGGILTPDADYSLRIWGPPDEAGSYGVHEQGGGNLTDFAMSFDLTPEGIVIHRMDSCGVRSRWHREAS